MKKLLALLLALCLTFGTSGMVFAEEVPPDNPETAVTETQQEETPAYTNLEDTDAENTGDTNHTLDSGMPDADSNTNTGTGSNGNASVTKEKTEQLHFSTIHLGDLFSQSTARPRSAVEDYFGNKLTGNAKVIYLALLDYFKEIDSTGSGESMVQINDGLSGTTFEDCEAAVDALLKDHAELIYWLSKDGEFVSATNDPGTLAICIFPVIPAYQNGAALDFQGFPYYKINAAKGEGGQTKADALKIAAEIVASVSGSDYEKVKAFNTKICELTSYDSAAAKPGAPYDDASQMIHVFLGKPVVCEGYAKSFKYLCDQANIGCFIVEGQLNKVNHMWNYVELDGKWYIVDVTNNDSSSNIEKLLAIGSNNSNYKGKYDTTKAIDGEGKPFAPLNPSVTLSAEDYKPGQPPAVNEKVRLVVQDAVSDSVQIVVTSDTRAMDYEGKYTLSKDDISVTEVTATGANGKTYFPNEIYNQGGGCYSVFFDSPLPAGQYSLKVKDKPGFTVTEITNNPFTIKQKMSTPKITFAPPDTQGAVLVTISMPEEQSNNVTIEYCVNDGELKQGSAPITFTIAADNPDKYPTKEIFAAAFHDDYERSEDANASYSFVPATDAFQVVVTPSSGLKGVITTKTLMATLSAKNAKGDVTYEIDSSKYYGDHGGFIVEGNKVYSEDGYEFGPIYGFDYTYHPLYVIAVDNRNDPTMANPVAYGSATIEISPAGSGGDQGGDSDSDDSDSGSSGGSSGGGSSSNTSNSGSSSSIEKVYTVVDAVKDVDKAISIAFDKGIPTAEINLKNTTKLPFKVIEAVNQKVQLQGKPLTVMIRSDVIKNNAVESRLYLDLSKVTLTTDLDLSIKLENQVVTNVFDKYFDNQTAVIAFAQAGTFGIPVEVAAKLDLSKLNTKTLKFYTYDVKTNSYAEMTAPNPWIDANGYLHFTTTIGNNVVITDKPLNRK